MSVRRVMGGVGLAATFLFSVAVAAAGAGAGADKISELQTHFDRETNAVHRAKLLEKLGDAQFDQARRAFKANDLVAVGIVLEKYRDNVRVALDGLKKKHADAERQSSGYRQLEIHVRRGIREVDEILLRVPEQYQPPLHIVRSDLDGMDRELIRMLFRYRDEQGPNPGHATSPAPEPPGEVKP
jgi:hypothetical protein